MTKASKPGGPAAQYDPPHRFIAALAAGAIVEMYDGPQDAPWLAFTLRSGGAAIHVVTPQSEVVGVFATAMAAAVYGFRRLDREAEERHASDPSDQPAPVRTRKHRERVGMPDGK